MLLFRDAFIEEAKKLNHEIDLINIYEEKTIEFWSNGENHRTNFGL